MKNEKTRGIDRDQKKKKKFKHTKFHNIYLLFVTQKLLILPRGLSGVISMSISVVVTEEGGFAHVPYRRDSKANDSKNMVDEHFRNPKAGKTQPRHETMQ